ncbi:hypothetical protein HYT56_02625 [Candidatus Woesearchaeota archaeon]|nr:hypothetical protein [Candidatus Woesearchaeota archaeon]
MISQKSLIQIIDNLESERKVVIDRLDKLRRRKKNSFDAFEMAFRVYEYTRNELSFLEMFGGKYPRAYYREKHEELKKLSPDLRTIIINSYLRK